MRLLGISGSLRIGSSNHAVLGAIRQLEPAIDLHVYDGVGRLPHFSPDLDTDNPPSEVATFRELVRSADALVVCSPEYAHGIPGALKNALDWLVSSGEIIDKHVLLWTSGHYVHDQLLEVLRTITNNVLVEGARRIERARQSFDKDGRLVNVVLAEQLASSMSTLRAALAR
ncbi:MAG: azr 2 [Myxococcaceae bacterium]|nr:azr 2 [Myxococcaceae bacterium]